MDSGNTDRFRSYRPLFFLLIAVLIIAAYWGGLTNLVERWSSQEEYSHGFFLPFLALYFAWHKRALLAETPRKPSWLGALLVLIAAAMLVIGELSALYILVHYSLILTIYGMVLAYGGMPWLRPLFWPIFLLVFAIPLPYFIDSTLSWRLQLLSSELGVWFIRLFDIPVYLQGNVIDLGNYKLQVVDACSGLRYLYPLMGLGFIAAYLFNAPFWQRLLVFLSTIPITIVMNSLRIGVIGVLVDVSGTGVADGFVHQFEGWAVFMVSAALLFIEMYLLNRLGNPGRSLRDVFGLPEEQPSTLPRDTPRRSQPMLTAPLILSAVVIALTLLLVDQREELVPARQPFDRFPESLGGWMAREQRIPPNILNKLQLDDYLNANYHRQQPPEINLYIAYYGSQRKGVSPHSPRVCIPGNGWQITAFERTTIPVEENRALPINRVEIERGDQKQVVYYWFRQRGRDIANEYLMKLDLLYDALTRNRTDGALVRVTAPLDEDSAKAENALRGFIQRIHPLLNRFIPD